MTNDLAPRLSSHFPRPHIVATSGFAASHVNSPTTSVAAPSGHAHSRRFGHTAQRHRTCSMRSRQKPPTPRPTAAKTLRATGETANCLNAGAPTTTGFSAFPSLSVFHALLQRTERVGPERRYAKTVKPHCGESVLRAPEIHDQIGHHLRRRNWSLLCTRLSVLRNRTGQSSQRWTAGGSSEQYGAVAPWPFPTKRAQDMTVGHVASQSPAKVSAPYRVKWPRRRHWFDINKANRVEECLVFVECTLFALTVKEHTEVLHLGPFRSGAISFDQVFRDQHGARRGQPIENAAQQCKDLQLGPIVDDAT